MEYRNTINFFWSGNDWSYLHDMTIKSHMVVDHRPVIWLHGNKPKSKYWNDDIYTTNGGEIRDADDIVDISNFIKNGGNFKTASSLWRFTFLYEYGGWYADTDALAVRTWPNEEWVLCNNYNCLISTGVLKVPPKQSMFLGMIKGLKYDWGNVKVFNHHYTKHFGNNTGTIDGRLFFPFTWKKWNILIDPDWNDNIIKDDTYSIHLYHTMFERDGIIDTIESFIKNNEYTLLGYLDKWIKSEL
jgi:hypothetical protein